ncbi:uncharacterized protein LOC129810425 [Phlebotomus papatasi]|uniref:uncharacterized protein LOC129810425 n=1 Tax=Phlebotomus papatasi TaxID=29031 RepID=UPI0024836F80|nr:uncharacterized protein LOC129810425 [Phlebotomus papatasi]
MTIIKYLLARRMLRARRQREFRTRMKNLMLEYFSLLLKYKMRRIRTVWAYSRMDAAWVRLRDEAPEAEFKDAFRMSRESFWKLVELLREDLQHQPNLISTRIPVPPEKQVALTLYKLASCAEYRVIGDAFGIHKSTLCQHFHRVIKCINEKLVPRLIRMPKQDECRESAREFQNISSLPQIIGVLDRSHIPISSPEEDRKDFLNSRDYASIILQATVDHDKKFIDISVKHPGSCNDAFVFKNSCLYLRKEELIPRSNFHWNGVNIPYLIIGDPAYPLLPWLMKDFNEPNLPEEKDQFNKRLNRARVSVEAAFGRLKGRWRILLKRSEIGHTFMPEVVAACCSLHNFVEDENETFHINWNLTPADLEQLPQPKKYMCQENDSLEGSIIRNTLVNYNNPKV